MFFRHAQESTTESHEPLAPFPTQGPAGAQRATFAAGCFWGIESAFRELEGVVATSVGYSGGTTMDPTYEQVCRGRTGHAEAVDVWFDPKAIDYETLLSTFWEVHNPTTRNRQGVDVGSQYRSMIFTHSDEQLAQAQASLGREQTKRSRPIVTEIVGAQAYFRAEEYHQRYFEKSGRTACALTLR